MNILTYFSIEIRFKTIWRSWGIPPPPPPSRKSATLTPEKGRAKNSILAANEIRNGPERAKRRLCWRKTFGVFGGAFPRQFFWRALRSLKFTKIGGCIVWISIHQLMETRPPPRPVTHIELLWYMDPVGWCRFADVIYSFGINKYTQPFLPVKYQLTHEK